MHTYKRSIRFMAQAVVGLYVLGLFGVLLNEADARRARGTTRTSVHTRSNVNRSAHTNRNVSRSVHTNKNVNRNVHVNKNVNVNRNVNVYGRNNNYHRNVGGAIAVGAVTGVVVGSIVAASSLPPSCTTVVLSDISYMQCDNTWYQPQYSGTQVTYIIVNPPQ